MPKPTRTDRRLMVLGAACVSLAGCAVEPIVGSWRNTVSVLGQDLVSEYDFQSDHTLATSTRYTYPPDAPMYASCTEVHRGTGARWATSVAATSGVLTVTPPATPMGTVERTGCAHGTENAAPYPADSSSMGMTSESTYTFSIAGNTLTLTATGTGMPGLPVTFTRATN